MKKLTKNHGTISSPTASAAKLKHEAAYEKELYIRGINGADLVNLGDGRKARAEGYSEFSGSCDQQRVRVCVPADSEYN